MPKDEKASGKGTIQKGGDRSGYLGHYRSSDNMKRGHNQGAPGMGPLSHPILNPISNPQGFQAATQSAGMGRRMGGVAGTAGAPTAPPTQGKVSGGTGTPLAPKSPGFGSRSNMTKETGGGFQTPPQPSIPMPPGPIGGPKAQAMPGPREQLGQAIGNLRTARQNLGGAVGRQKAAKPKKSNKKQGGY